MARTTIDLDLSVLGELKRRARRERKSMGQVASEVLARGLPESSEAQGAVSAFRWRPQRMGVPRVDLEDKEAVQRALDGE